MLVLSWMGSQKLVAFLAKPSKDLTILRDRKGNTSHRQVLQLE
jgi:hypothetical protein